MRMIVMPEIREDTPGLYSLTRDWLIMSRKVVMPDVNGAAFRIRRALGGTLITVYAYDSTPDNPHCDGVSIFPNRILGVSLLEAAMFHDPWYERLEALAKALGWPVWKVRHAGDVIFRELIIETNKGRRMAVPVAWAAYFGVRIFGGIYHWAHMQTT